MLAGRYEMGDVLGQGGLGVVHEAHDTVLDRVVAIKSLHERHANDPEHVQRLDEEARASASFSHPNAVILYDVVREDGRMHLVLEYVDGGPLPRLLRGSLLPESLAWVVGADVASALGAAHARGLVHRDVKPSNVLVTGEGNCKLSDFGIARMVGGDQDRLTQAGMVVGSPAYLAPEQVEDVEVDGRADVYALGLLLGEAVSGTLGFGEGTQSELLTRRLARPPERIRDRADVTDEFDELVTAMTAKDPRSRPDAVVVAVSLRGGIATGAREAMASRLSVAEDVDEFAPTTVIEAPDQSTVSIRPIDLGVTRPVDDPAPAPDTHPEPDPGDVGASRQNAGAPAEQRRRSPEPDPGDVGASRQNAGAPAEQRRRSPEPDETQVLEGPVDEVAWGPTAGSATPMSERVDDGLVAVGEGAGRLGRRANGVAPIIRWLIGGAVALVLLVVAVDVFTDGDGAPAGDATTAPDPSAERITVAAVDDLDPFGNNGEEHPEDLPFLVDDDPATAWDTERYNARGLDKPGVGLVFDLGEPLPVSQVAVVMQDGGSDIELYAATEDPAGRPAPEAGTLVQRLEGLAAAEVAFDGGGTEARWWILWITRVGGGGRTTIGEVTFR